MAKHYKYRVLTIYRDKRATHSIMVDYLKNESNQIVVINNTSKMIQKFDSAKEAKENIDKLGKIDFIVTNILGLREDAIFISQTMSKADKGKVFNRYADSYASIQKTMQSKPSKPIAGQVFEQDMLTADYFFFFEELNPPTFTLLFGVDLIINAKSKILIDEFNSLYS